MRFRAAVKVSCKTVELVASPRPPHFVGDGFRVHNFIPVASEWICNGWTRSYVLAFDGFGRDTFFGQGSPAYGR